MNKKLVFLDIDGTLTVPGHNTPPESALAAIKDARAAGHRVFLCTGRNKAMLSPLLACGFDGVVASAGGYVFMGERVLFDCPMPAADRELALRLLRENGVSCTLEARDATWADWVEEGKCAGEAPDKAGGPAPAAAEGRDCRESREGGDTLFEPGENANSELLCWRNAIARQLNILPAALYDGRPVYKIVFMCREVKQLEPARRVLEKDYNFVVQGYGDGMVNGELINRRFDKGLGVRIVAEALGFSLEDTVGFGDSMNDLEMIETVGTGVCMENGSPALKEKSSLICPRVEEDGLARGFAQLGLGTA